MTKSEAKRVAQFLNAIEGPIKVGPFDYNLNFHDEPLRISEDGPRAYKGTCWVDGGEIDVSLHTITPAKLAETIIHESLHAMFHHAGLHRVKKPDEEDIVQAFGQQLTGWIKANPKLIKSLQEVLK